MRLFNPFPFKGISKSTQSVLQQSELFRIPPLSISTNARLITPTEDALEMLRRRVRDDGIEIIDKPTYNKITKDFRRTGGELRADDESERYLLSRGAHAIYMRGENLIMFKKNPGVSEVLEETFHARQDRLNRFSDEPSETIMNIKREIEAQHYLLSMADKYKIPKNEIEQTQKNLEFWQNKLKQENDKRR